MKKIVVAILLSISMLSTLKAYYKQQQSLFIEFPTMNINGGCSLFIPSQIYNTPMAITVTMLYEKLESKQSVVELKNHHDYLDKARLQDRVHELILKADNPLQIDPLRFCLDEFGFVNLPNKEQILDVYNRVHDKVIAHILAKKTDIYETKARLENSLLVRDFLLVHCD